MVSCEKKGKSSGIFGSRKAITFSLAVLFCFCLVLGGTSKGGAETPVCGTIFSDATWTKANSPYIVTCGVILDSGVTLTIQPGVEVRFEANCSLTIDGTLIARGTSLDPIVFTANNPYWAYIHFRDSSTDAFYDVSGNYVSGSILQYCTVEYAGAAGVSNNGALRLEKAHPYIDHCTLKNNMTRGICAWDLTGTLKITHSTISHNLTADNGGGIFLKQSSYPNPNPLGRSCLSNNTISFNQASYDGGGVYSQGSIDISRNTISFNQASHNGGGYYLYQSGNPGAIFEKNFVYNNKATNGGGLFSHYRYNTIRENIFLQNRATNEAGGMNADKTVTKNIFSGNQAKYYGGLYRGDSMSLNSIVGNTSLEDYILLFTTSSIVEYNLVAYNHTTGSAPTNTIICNYSGIRLNYNNFFKNSTTYELANIHGSDVDARYNWWGTAMQGEIEEKIYDRQDDPTRGVVDFAPWDPAIRTDVPISPPQNLTVTQGQANFSLSWQANPEGNVAGYKIYWGEMPGYPYSNVLDVGKVAQYTFAPSGLPPPGKYFFAVTAYNSNYNLSKIGHPDYDPTNPAYIEDDNATMINELQTAGYESWFSEEAFAEGSSKPMPWLLLLLDN